MISTIRRKIYEQRAAKMGLTVEQFLEWCDREAAKQREINELIMDRDLQIAAIDRFARAHGRTFAWSIL